MRKLLILIILAVMIWFCYVVIANGVTYGIFSVENYDYIQEKSSELDDSIDELRSKTTTEFNERKSTLDNSIKRYKSAKSNFEELEETQKELAISSVDLVDIDFLWTIIGNYASDEEVLLQFQVRENASKKTESTSYILCDLYFKASGEYKDVTKFIYNIEDDDRLSFEINDFNMVKHPVEVIDSRNKTTEEVKAEEEEQEKWVDAEFVAKAIPLNYSTISEITNLDTANALNEINAVLANQNAE